MWLWSDTQADTPGVSDIHTDWDLGIGTWFKFNEHTKVKYNINGITIVRRTLRVFNINWKTTSRLVLWKRPDHLRRIGIWTTTSAQEAAEDSLAEESKSEHTKSEGSENVEESGKGIGYSIHKEANLHWNSTLCQTGTEIRYQSSRIHQYRRNTTNKTLKQVRIEFHLSNRTELGPTEPSNLESEKSMEVKLFTEGEEFSTWGVHPEVGESSSWEHSSEENHDESGESSMVGDDWSIVWESTDELRSCSKRRVCRSFAVRLRHQSFEVIAEQNANDLTRFRRSLCSYWILLRC